MFGLSKKERYERKVEVSLIAMFCDFGEGSGKIVPDIKKRFLDHWDQIMKEGVELSNSPETTALCIAVQFYRDAIRNHISPNEIDFMKKHIIERNYEPDIEMGILFRLRVTFYLASRMSTAGIIPRDIVLASLRDIHRAIYDNGDDKLDDTVIYFIEGGNCIAKQIREVQETGTLQGMVKKLEWSNNPGAHEAHLIRRSNNMYFPKSRRIVLEDELSEARSMDNEDYILVAQRFAEVEKEIEAISSTLTVGDLHEIRERLDNLILFAMGVGGAAKEIASKADQLRDAVISDMRAAFSDDEETLENIERAETYHKDNTRKFYIPVMAQICRENSPILKEETISTILSEDSNSISIFINFLPEDDRALIRLEALKMMQEVLNDGYIDPQFEEKLSALEGEWDFKQEMTVRD